MMRSLLAVKSKLFFFVMDLDSPAVARSILLSPNVKAPLISYSHATLATKNKASFTFNLSLSKSLHDLRSSLQLFSPSSQQCM